MQIQSKLKTILPCGPIGPSGPVNPISPFKPGNPLVPGNPGIPLSPLSPGIPRFSFQEIDFVIKPTTDNSQNIAQNITF